MILRLFRMWVRVAVVAAVVVSAMNRTCSIATADDQTVITTAFEPVAGNPVFVSAPGKWDTKIRERGWILKEDSGWKLWYTGYNPDQQPPMMNLGLATSQDGITWTRSPENPIVSDYWVEDMMVVKHDGEYSMFAESAEENSQLLKSKDGIHWDRKGVFDVRLVNGQPISAGPIGTPTAFFEDGVWNLFYERRDAGIWLARSTDMKIWTNVSDEPLILPGPKDFDSLMIAMNQVIRVGDHYIAVMHGTGTPMKPRLWCTYLATSPDLVHWTKDPRGPLFPINENKSSGQLVQDGKFWRLYTMHDKVDLHVPIVTH